MLATAPAPTRAKARGSREQELERENVALRARVAELEAALAKALEEIDELTARAKENSANSHRPPSSDRKRPAA